LWNDYKTALAIAKTVNLQFIRIPVFVDTVKTAFGTIRGEARKVVIERKALDAEHVALLTDIHVKHSELISKMSLEESACTAIQAGSDGIIITGRWTGQSPDLSEVQKLRRKIGLFPLLVGSGLSSENASELLQYANGAIVSTSLKSGSIKAGEHNVKSYSQRISITRVRKLRERM
jgi:membrane complex biogenesis BtpA family protein